MHKRNKTELHVADRVIERIIAELVANCLGTCSPGITFATLSAEVVRQNQRVLDCNTVFIHHGIR